MSQFTVSIKDHTATESPGSINVYVPDDLIDDGDGSTPPRDQAELLSLLSALTIGTVGQSTLITRDVHAVGSSATPADPQAQKEKRWRVSFRDNVTNKVGSFTIPCADLTLLPAGSEFLDLTAGGGLALKTWLDAYGESDIGNPITVSAIKFVTA